MSAPHRDPLPVAGAARGREVALWCAIAVAGALALIWGWRWNIALNDYGTEAATSFTALLHGRISAFLQSAPAYGPSLLLRAPFALPASLTGGSALLVYRLSALPCLLAIGALGVWLAVTARRGGATLATAALTVVLCAANPITYRVLATGHPEELLGAALCVAAVLLAQRGHANLAALALGLAIANKEWGLLAIGPVFVALPAQRRRAMTVAAAVALALLAPIALASGSVGALSGRLAVSDNGGLFHPWQLFWFFGPRGHWLPAMLGSIPRGFRLKPAWVAAIAHPLIVWIELPLTLLALRRRTSAGDALALLALLLLLRCYLDPWDLVYYPLPFIFALAAWETTVARRMPIGAAVATAATWLIFWYLPGHIGLDAQALSFLVPSTLTIAALAAVTYRRAPLRHTSHAAAGLLSRAPAVPS